MSEQKTLVTHVGVDTPEIPGLPAGYTLRPCSPSDFEPLGNLYFEAYEPGVACSTREEAIADIEATFDGAYGDLWPDASPIVDAGGRIVSGAMTVRRAPWEDTPDCPFVVELFTDRRHRRQGLATALIRQVLSTSQRAGATQVALRVADDNIAALRLYESLGFENWRPDSS
jgi:GNAT superfamily N-acetyltransferase